MRLMKDLSKVASFLIRHTRGGRHSRRSLILVLIVGVISGLSTTALVAVMNLAISSRNRGSMTLLWAFAALCILTPLTRYISSVLLSSLNNEATFEIGVRLCRRILDAPLRQLEQVGPHRLQATLGDIATIGGVVTALPNLVMNFALVAGCLIYMGWLSLTLLAGLIAVLALGIVMYQIPLVKARRCYRISRDKTDGWLKHFRAIVEGIKELKLNSRRSTSFYSTLLRPTAEDIKQLNYQGSVFIAAANSLGQFMTFVPIGLLIFIVPMLMDIRLEVTSGYILAFIYMIGPLTGIMGSVQSVSIAAVSVDKIESLNLAPVDTLPPTPAEQPSEAAPWKHLVLSGVTHTYYNEEKEHDFTLGPIDLTFNPGEMVFLVGGNGSGKTTLAKLLTGLYVPESGEIIFNGRPVTDENREQYCQHFSMLFSDFFLFETLLGLEQVPDLMARASQYLSLLRLDRKVQVKNGELSTINLSQGQRKRLALLMAYLEDRPIYIFDEWAADQDPVFREVFYRQLLPDMKARGKTIIVISHDDRYYGIGDRIIQLDYGQVADDSPTARPREAMSGLLSSLSQVPALSEP